MSNLFHDPRNCMTIEVDEDVQEMSLDYMGERAYTYGRKRARAIDQIDGTKTEWVEIERVSGLNQEEMLEYFQRMLFDARELRTKQEFEYQYLQDSYRYKPGDELRPMEMEFETIRQADGTYIKRAISNRTLGDEAQLYKEAEWNRINEAKKLAELERIHKLDREKEAAARAMLHAQQQARLKAELEAVELEAIREDEPNFGAFS